MKNFYFYIFLIHKIFLIIFLSIIDGIVLSLENDVRGTTGAVRRAWGEPLRTTHAARRAPPEAQGASAAGGDAAAAGAGVRGAACTGTGVGSPARGWWRRGGGGPRGKDGAGLH